MYNPATSFMHYPKMIKVILSRTSMPEEYTPHILESNAWHYFWSVQHDVDGLISLVGGKERFSEKL